MGRFALGCACVLGLWIAVLAGCATDDTPTASQSGVVKANPSFSADIQEIFDRRGCSANNCHGTTAQAGLDLRAGKSWDELVNVPSFQRPQFPRVRPAHAQDSSYLIDKLDGTGAQERMPNDATGPLNSVDMQNIINWIHQGAFDN